MNVDLTKRELTVLRVALISKMSALRNGDIYKANITQENREKKYHELRDLCQKLGAVMGLPIFK